MKRLLTILVLMSSMAYVVACGNSGGGSNSPGTVAATPQACNNQGLPGAYSNCGSYNTYYGQQGSYPNGWYWPTTYSTSVGTCGCNVGYYPVQGPFGTACAPGNYFNGAYGNVTFGGGYGGGAYWNYGQNGGYYGQPQVNYSNPYNSCTSSTAQGCDVRLNNCGGGRCVPVGGGSTIGLCVR